MTNVRYSSGMEESIVMGDPLLAFSPNRMLYEGQPPNNFVSETYRYGNTSHFPPVQIMMENPCDVP